MPIAHAGPRRTDVDSDEPAAAEASAPAAAEAPGPATAAAPACEKRIAEKDLPRTMKRKNTPVADPSRSPRPLGRL